MEEILAPRKKRSKDLEVETTSQGSDNVKRVGRFITVAGDEVIVEVDGNGERIPYVAEKHQYLKYGDTLEF